MFWRKNPKKAKKFSTAASEKIETALIEYRFELYFMKESDRFYIID